MIPHEDDEGLGEVGKPRASGDDPFLKEVFEALNL